MLVVVVAVVGWMVGVGWSVGWLVVNKMELTRAASRLHKAAAKKRRQALRACRFNSYYTVYSMVFRNTFSAGG